MERLIDADKVIDHLEKVKKESHSLVDVAHIIGFQSVIDAQTTAYDVDKVVEQLEELTEEECTLHECGIRSERCKPCIAKRAIEIVKGGGVDV